MTVIDRFYNFLNPNKQVDIAPLVIFRIIFGSMMLFGALRFVAKGWVYDMYIKPEYYFGYLGFEWVKPFPDQWMYLPFVLICIAALGVILGIFYRLSSILLFLSFTYIELLDKSNYLNHYYFISLMAFLMIWVPANRCFSLDVKFNRIKEVNLIPQWGIGIIKLQLALVYIFAGIAKLETDWLFEAQPLKIWLQAHRDMPIFGPLLAKDWVAYFFSWFGCVYDLFIVFFLLKSKTRPFAYLFVLVFHFVTWYLLPIGIFPWIMIFSTLIFFDATLHRKVLTGIKSLFRRNDMNLEHNIQYSTLRSNAIITFFTLYFLIQLFLPFRYLLYRGPLFWTEEGFRFSWRVMLMHKEGHATFFVVDSKTNGEIQVQNSRFLSEIQEDQMSTQPDMILQYADFLQQKFKDSTLQINGRNYKIHQPQVKAQIYVSLNGRPSTLFVSKEKELNKISYNLYNRFWLEPFHP